uniref:Uncharacterized protein n=1 Tax=viral metagenome TaxID=1070528 RepID=A0A6C0M285_9ZZZZ
MVTQLQIVRVPLERRPPDLPPDFPKLHNLRLEFLEDKRKLKDGLPLIPLKVTVDKRSKPVTKEHTVEEEEHTVEEQPPTKQTTPHSNVSESHSDDEDDREMRKTLEDDRSSVASAASAVSGGEEEEEGSVGDAEEIEDGDSDSGSGDSDAANSMTPEEREEMEREEYLFKFEILRKKNRSADIPVFTRHTPVETMKRSYNSVVRRVHLDSATESYRHYMIAGFLVTEFVCTKWAGIDLTGFAKQQIAIMYKYDQLLIELGEKTYSPTGSKLPVEVRLIGFVILQAGIFYIGKMLMGINGGDGGNPMNAIYTGLMGNQLPQVSAENRPRPKGPSLSPEDIRRMNAQQS